MSCSWALCVSCEGGGASCTAESNEAQLSCTHAGGMSGGGFIGAQLWGRPAMRDLARGAWRETLPQRLHQLIPPPSRTQRGCLRSEHRPVRLGIRRLAQMLARQKPLRLRLAMTSGPAPQTAGQAKVPRSTHHALVPCASDGRSTGRSWKPLRVLPAKASAPRSTLVSRKGGERGARARLHWGEAGPVQRQALVATYGTQAGARSGESEGRRLGLPPHGAH